VTSWDAQATTLADARRAVWSEADELYAARTALCVQLLEDRLSLDDGAVLDLGCGIGRLTIPLAEQHPRCRFVGLDTSPAMLTHAVTAGAHLHNVVWVHGPPLPRLARAYSMVAVQHMDPETVAAYLALIAAALLPDGRLVFQYVVGDHHGGHDHRYERTVMHGLLAGAGLRPIEEEQGVLYDEWCWVTAVRS